MHLVVHVSLGLAPAAVDNEHVDEDQGDYDANDSANTDAFAIDDGCLLNFLLHVQRLETLVRRGSETRADSVEDAQRFNLAAISLLVDYDRRVNVGTILLPVVDLSIDGFVHGLGVTPGRLSLTPEAVLDALLRRIPV